MFLPPGIMPLYGGSLTLLGPWLRKEYGNLRDRDNPPFVKDAVAHGERADGAEPHLARLLREVDQWLPKLRLEAQPPVKFFQGRKERLAVAALPGNVRQGKQPLPHSFRVHHPIRH